MKTVRGATTVDENTPQAISDAVKELLAEILKRNKIKTENVQSVIFTCTADITAAYPAKFAREIGFEAVPLLCVQEMNVDNSLPMCLRILMTVEGDFTVRHIFLKDAINLRKDLN